MVPLQQPFGHEVALQTQLPLLVEQVVPVAHGAQAAPDFPHWLMVWFANGTQVAPLQHPFAHDEAFLSWFVALAVARVPSGFQGLGAYCLRYQAQTFAYVLLLTDRYPTLASGNAFQFERSGT